MLHSEQIRLLPELNKAQADAAEAKRLVGGGTNTSSAQRSADRFNKDKAGLKGAESYLAGIEEQLKNEEKRQRELHGNPWKWWDVGHNMSTGVSQLLSGRPEDNIKELKEARINAQKNIEQIQKRVHSEETTKESSLEHQKDTEEKARKLQDRFDDLGRSVEKSKLKMEELSKAPLTAHMQNIIANRQYPTVQELAESGYWTRNHFSMQPIWNQTPVAREANLLQLYQRDEVNARIKGNFGRADNDVLAIQQLKAELRNAGYISPEDAAQKTETKLEDISTTLQKGISVTVKNTD
jgi:hypothetical protein